MVGSDGILHKRRKSFEYFKIINDGDSLPELMPWLFLVTGILSMYKKKSKIHYYHVTWAHAIKLYEIIEK